MTEKDNTVPDWKKEEGRDYIDSGSRTDNYSITYNGEKRCLRILRDESNDESAKRNVLSLEKMKEIDHPNIVKWFAIEGVGKSGNKTCIVVELMDGNIKQLINSSTKLSDSDKLGIILSVVNASAFLISKKIRPNVTGSNILFRWSEPICIKLADPFTGLENNPNSSNSSRSVREEEFSPEEYINKYKPDSYSLPLIPEADTVWHIGLLMNYVWSAGLRVPGKIMNMYRFVETPNERPECFSPYPNCTPNGVSDLILSCLAFSAKDRPTLFQLSQKLSNMRAMC